MHPWTASDGGGGVGGGGGGGESSSSGGGDGDEPPLQPSSASSHSPARMPSAPFSSCRPRLMLVPGGAERLRSTLALAVLLRWRWRGLHLSVFHDHVDQLFIVLKVQDHLGDLVAGVGEESRGGKAQRKKRKQARFCLSGPSFGIQVSSNVVEQGGVLAECANITGSIACTGGVTET